MWQTEALAPFGWGLQVAPSSVHGTTVWTRGENRLEIAAIARGWRATLALKLDGKWLRGSAEIEQGEGLALVFPLAPKRLAYTHKDAGMLAELHMKFDDQPLPRQGLATLDWTRSAALRTTRWNWASCATRLKDGRRLGLNLSAHVYDDAAGASTENALWLDGQLQPLGGVTFALPASPASEVWHVQGPEVELAFSPLGARRQNLNLGIIRSRFVQPFGHFAGTIRLPSGETLVVPASFGVVEDHLAVW